VLGQVGRQAAAWWQGGRQEGQAGRLVDAGALVTELWVRSVAVMGAAGPLLPDDTGLISASQKHTMAAATCTLARAAADCGC
jgi:hypothetical protein